MKHSNESAVYADPHDSELPLFSGIPAQPPTEPPPTRQQQELDRVSSKISDWIKLFFDAHQVGEQFHADDLHNFVKAKANIAPASADRVMRDLRQRGEINYEVSRSESKYTKLAVGM